MATLSEQDRGDILYSPVKMRHAAHLGSSTHGGHKDPVQPAGGADEQHPWRPQGPPLQPAGGYGAAAAVRKAHSKGDHDPFSSHATFQMNFKSSTKTCLQSR